MTKNQHKYSSLCSATRQKKRKGQMKYLFSLTKYSVLSLFFDFSQYSNNPGKYLDTFSRCGKCSKGKVVGKTS